MQSKAVKVYRGGKQESGDRVIGSSGEVRAWAVGCRLSAFGFRPQVFWRKSQTEYRQNAECRSL